MKVKELIEKLQQFNPNAIVCVEAWMDPVVNEVNEYIIDDIPHVYIGDALENLEYDLGVRKEEE